MTDERIEQLQALQSARATCERMGIGYVGMAGKIPWLLDTIARLSTERDEAMAELARRPNLANVQDTEFFDSVQLSSFADTLQARAEEYRARAEAAEASRDALLTAAKALLPLMGGWRELIAMLDDMPKDESVGKAMWAALDHIDHTKRALRALVPSELAPSQGGEQ